MRAFNVAHGPPGRAEWTIQLDDEMVTRLAPGFARELPDAGKRSGLEIFARREQGGVEADSDDFEKWVAIHEADVNGTDFSCGNDPASLGEIGGNARAEGEIVVGADRNDPEGNLTADQCASGRLHRAVASRNGDPLPTGFDKIIDYISRTFRSVPDASDLHACTSIGHQGSQFLG
jgi:hypothetical protein